MQRPLFLAIGVAFAIALAGPAGAGDWPTISRNLARDGFTADCVRPPYETKWIRSWPGEIVTTRVQAIVADGKVFIGTYSGRLHAVDAETGADLWTFQADGPILHSPAFEGGMIHFGAASPSRSLFCLRARDGEIVWKSECGEGGFCTSPAIAGARILIGGRDGIFRAIAAISGREEWSFRTGGPIRTTAAISGDRVFVASDDMHAYALRIADGGLVWKSEKMYGQSLRDYAPVVLGDVVVFRTNPMEQMGVHLGRSYNLIGRTAGIDMSSWKNVDAFVKSEKARGSPEAFEKEQRAILEYLASHPQARTFYALDAATGKERFRAPVLWGAGCQGVGIPPVRVGDGRAIVFNRTAYGNWTLGVAPMVGLQAIDLRADPRPPEEALGSIPTIRTIPLFHSKGNQPPWNTYWGTADETSVYSCGGTILYVTHQGTLSGYDLETHDLFPIAGKRDTWGGESSLPWARNEWHGPARGAVAIAGDSLYWVTGSRIIAIRGRGADPNAAGERSKRANEAGGMIRAPAGAEELRRRLDRAVSDYLSAPDYAPLLIEIGLGSHDFFFDTAAEVVATLAMADPYLERGLQVRARERMRREMGRHPLCGKESRYALDVGERRELYTITGERFFYGWEAPEALSEAYALWLYGDRTGDWGTVERYWPRARGAFEAVAAKGWSVDIEKGDRFANGSIAGMIGVARLARRFGDEKTADAASRAAAENLRRLAEHWRNGVASLPFDQKIENVAAVDGFIGAGNALFFKVVPHRQKIVKFLDLTPEVGRAIADEAPEAARFYLDFVDLVLPGWYLAFEERQVHFGENYADFPDLALGVFEAKAWIEGAPGDALARWVDIPWCRGDLYYIRKLAIAIEAMDAQSSAGDILEAAGIQGGLVVHLGCGDGRLTAALHASDAYLVQGLDEDPDAVRRARHHVDSLGLYGPVSIDVLRGQSLPYADNLVNLVVVTGRGSGVTREELARVLAPNGVAMIRGAPCDLDGWTKWVKPRPADIDEWTHYLHGPDNNAVSRDAVVGPPRHLQWIAPPRFSRSHDHLASVSAVVSAGGRLFSIIDGGSIAFVAAAPRWRLIARDASSGVRLWERNVGDWEYHLRDFRSGPADIARRLVAAGDRVYVTLGYGEPVTALDAATGETIHTYAETEGTREILCCDGMLLLVLGKPNRDWPAQEAKRIVSQPDYRPPFELYTPPPHDLRVMAVDAANGKLLWRNDGPEAREALPSTLAAADGSVYFQSPDAVVCLDATTGLSRWKAPRPAHRKRLAWSTPTLVVRDGIVFSADRRAADTSGEILWLPSGGYHEYIRGEDIDGELIAFDARTGERLWSAPAYEGFNAPVDVLIADGLLWTGRYAWGNDPGITEARDPRTGQVVRRRLADQKFVSGMGHARCHRARATSRYLVQGRRGVEFVDLKTGTMQANFWVRGICQYGVMPANGLLYVPPHPCACSVTDLLKCGFMALAPAASEHAEMQRLERGPTFQGSASPSMAAGSDAPDDWPTYRHDSRRSGFTPMRVSHDLRIAWRTPLAVGLTSPVVAEGVLLVAQTETHRVYALDATTGEKLWTFVAGARIDSPPTIHEGRALFGSADGRVYCLRLKDGGLIWRFQAAPLTRSIVVDDQLESAWPVSGSVLVAGDAAYFVAGRTSYLDGGMLLSKLDVATGREIAVQKLAVKEEERDRGIASGGFLPDVLSADGDSIFLRNARFDLGLARQKDNVPHLWSPVGFLDASWWHRTYWQFGTSMASGWSGWAKAGQEVPAGRLLVTDGARVFGYGRNQYDTPGAHVGIDAEGVWGPIGPKQGRWTFYRLFGTALAKKAGGSDWTRRIPVLAQGMVLADRTLFVAGPTDPVREIPQEPSAVEPLAEALESTRGGRLLALSTADGSTLAEIEIQSPPVFDGMAAAGGRLYLTTKAGEVACMGPIP